jgi:hypothetical protein
MQHPILGLRLRPQAEDQLFGVVLTLAKSNYYGTLLNAVLELW